MRQSKFLKTVGNKIKQIRKEKGISLYKLAKISKLNYNHIKNIENGITDCHLEVFTRICESLAVSVTDFFNKIDL